MAKIGIFGGTFNPIHNGHLTLAARALKEYKLDRVYFMPSGNPPHKNNKDIVDKAHRARMVKKAIAFNKNFEFSALELESEETTYTYKTLKKIKEIHPDDKIYFIMGADSLRDFSMWRNPEIISRLCTILVSARDDISEKKIKKYISEYEKEYGAKIGVIHMKNMEISSEYLRNKIAKNIDVSGMIDKSVYIYIKVNHLYGYKKKVFKKTPDFKEIIDVLSSLLETHRFIHTMGVAMTSAGLATVFGADPQKAYLAGLLHDVAKYMTNEEQLALCEKYEIKLTKSQLNNLPIIHGELGAYMAQKDFGVNDTEVLNAIRYHTTLRPNMTELEKIVYAADYLEPTRDHDAKPYSLFEIRKVMNENLDKTVYMILEDTVNHLISTGKDFDVMTKKSYEYMIEHMKL